MPSEIFALYAVALASVAALALLLIVQVVVATAAAQTTGQVPGVAITSGPDSFAFRAQRAHQNSLENAVPFGLAVASAIALGLDHAIVDAAAVAFVATRSAHAVAYYANVRPARTAAFAFGLVAVLAMSIGALANVDAAAPRTSTTARSR